MILDRSPTQRLVGFVGLGRNPSLGCVTTFSTSLCGFLAPRLARVNFVSLASAVVVVAFTAARGFAIDFLDADLVFLAAGAIPALD